jgi:flagellar biosynthetic protein FliP
MIDRPETTSGRSLQPVRAWIWLAAMLVLIGARASLANDEPQQRATDASNQKTMGQPASSTVGPNQPTGIESTDTVSPLDHRNVARRLPPDTARTLQTVAVFGLISLAPIGLLMLTAFVRINIVLTLLRQALGSPQVPGNQVLTALALLLTALVMWPKGESVYRQAIQPYSQGQIDAVTAWTAGSQPIKTFMIDQIVRYRHEDYLAALHEYAVPPSPGQAPAVPERPEDFPIRVVMPAYLLSELTTALMMGFYIYLPFLVVDLVVSSVLAATGLFMLPPALVATPVKLILFVLADGWMLVADMLLASFAGGGGP